MSEHPIEGLMKTAMSSIQSLVDVNTIIGEAITVADSGIVIIPISKVCFGFAAGGSEFSGETMSGYKKQEKEETVEYKLPFGGGSGGTVSIRPVAFITINGDSVKINPIEHASVLDRLLDYVPDLMEKLNIDTDKIIKDKNCSCKKVKDDFEPTKSKVKNVTSIESDKGPITKKKIKIEYEDDDEFGLNEENMEDD